MRFLENNTSYLRNCFYHREHKAGTKFAKIFSESFVVSLHSLWFFFFTDRPSISLIHDF